MAAGRPAEARDLVTQLESLVDGPVAVLRLVALGEEAIEPLREYLLTGRITSVFQSRRWAVEALAALEARDALVEYLGQGRLVMDPVLRFSEDAVESAAARALAAWPSEEVFALLQERARVRLLPGLIEALGAFRRAAALPVFIRALEDDLCRRPAEDSLRTLGRAAVPALIRAAVTPWPDAGDESPSSRERRRSAAALLADLDTDRSDWPALRPLLHEADQALVIAAARIAVKTASESDRRLAASRLLSFAGTAPPPLSMDVEDCLVDLYPDAGDILEEELTRLTPPPMAQQTFDAGLALLLRVVRRVRKKV
jgi:hypothetical protein